MIQYHIVTMKESMLLKIVRYGLYVLLFIPIVIFSQYLSPFHFGKAILFRSGVELLFVVYALLIAKNRNWLPPRTLLFWSITAFTAAYGITSFTGVDLSVSFWGTLERMIGFYSMIHFWIFYVMLTGVFRTKKEWLDILKLSIIVSLLSAGYGFLQKTGIEWIIGSGGRNKIFGTLGNPALFAGYQLLNGFFALFLYFKKNESQNWHRFYGVAFIVSAIATVLSGVRGSVMGMVIGFSLFMLGYSYLLGTKKVRRNAFGTVGVIGLIFLTLVLFRNTDFVKNDQYLARFSDLSPTSYTVQTRTWTWVSGLKGWIESPRSMVLGYGPENFDIPFSHHFDPRHFNNIGSETLFDRAHNMFIEVLVTMGLFGELLYIAMFSIMFYGLWQVLKQYRNKKTPESEETVVLALGLIATLVAYLIHNFFIFDTTANYIVFFTAAGLINLLAYPKQVVMETNIVSRKKIPAVGYAVVIVLAGIAGWSIYSFNIKPAQANYTTTRAIVAGWNHDDATAMIKFKEAMDNYDVSIRYEIISRYSQYIIDRGSTGQKLTDDVKQGLLLSIEEEKKMVAQHPEDYVPLLYVSRAYILLGKDDPKSAYNDEALKYSTAALKISPTFVRTYFEVAQAYLNKKDYSKAIEAFRKAVALNPKTAVSQWYLGSALLESGNTEEGLKAMKAAIDIGYGPSENEYLRLVGIFVSKKDNAGVVSSYEQLVKINPNNAQYHASLAAAYAQVGRIDDALNQAREAVKIDPGFAPDAQAFAKALGRTL